MLPVSREVLLSELETARTILDKWVQRVQAGIPGIDMPATGNAEEHIDSFLREFCGEMRIVSGKCDNLSETMHEGMG